MYGSQGESCRAARERPAESAFAASSASPSWLGLLREEASIVGLKRLGEGLRRRLVPQQPLQLRAQRVVKGRGGPVHVVTDGICLIRRVPGRVEITGKGVRRDHLGGNRLAGKRSLFDHKLQRSLRDEEVDELRCQIRVLRVLG